MTPVRQLSPTNWSPNGGLAIPANSGFAVATPAIQVGGNRRGRQTIVIVNIGANKAVLTASRQDNPALGVTLLPAATWSIDTEGEVWVSSVSGTTIDVLETWWPQIAEGAQAQLKTNALVGALK